MLTYADMLITLVAMATDCSHKFQGGNACKQRVSFIFGKRKCI